MEAKTFFGVSALLAVIAPAFMGVAADPPQGPFQPTWKSAQAHHKVLEWFREGKSGIFPL